MRLPNILQVRKAIPEKVLPLCKSFSLVTNGAFLVQVAPTYAAKVINGRDVADYTKAGAGEVIGGLMPREFDELSAKVVAVSAEVYDRSSDFKGSRVYLLECGVYVNATYFDYVSHHSGADVVKVVKSRYQHLIVWVKGGLVVGLCVPLDLDVFNPAELTFNPVS